MGGLHGNEPAGPRAIASVLAQLEAERRGLRGEVIGLTGNRAALRVGRRYLGRDLNRRWLPADIRELLAPGSARREPEDDEQRELLAEIGPLLAKAREPIVFLDLHSTSGAGPPFSCMADVLRNRKVAFALPIPVILGIEEILEGALLGWLCDLGHVAVAVEGGQSDDPRTVQHHEAAIWLGLVATGALSTRATCPTSARHRDRLAAAARGLPAVIEIRHRHLVGRATSSSWFPASPASTASRAARWWPGTGRGRCGPRSAASCSCRAIRARAKMATSSPGRCRGSGCGFPRVLRQLRVDRLTPLLPGVRTGSRAEPDCFLVDPRVARFQVRNVFHLLGFRHERARGEALVFSRRRPGFRGLRPLPSELQGLRPEVEAPIPAEWASTEP